jgi:hypothetical protein
MIETRELFLRNPLYNELQIRKGANAKARAYLLYSREDVREKSVKELSDGVDAAFGFDHFQPYITKAAQLVFKTISFGNSVVNATWMQQARNAYIKFTVAGHGELVQIAELYNTEEIAHHSATIFHKIQQTNLGVRQEIAKPVICIRQAKISWFTIETNVLRVAILIISQIVQCFNHVHIKPM